ncbi:sperm acrosomal protein FSA-ACR.1-like [Homarus americanus]|uniref:sperm acrosomal protein FSA-ACR.1-like n=1 Tax=Homarus americanus TaxID=6706 RepID=UPI001C476614|nr:sperm acrosomal protein FSA-ACR.1-like [Homarus americanus]
MLGPDEQSLVVVSEGDDTRGSAGGQGGADTHSVKDLLESHLSRGGAKVSERREEQRRGRGEREDPSSVRTPKETHLSETQPSEHTYQNTTIRTQPSEHNHQRHASSEHNLLGMTVMPRNVVPSEHSLEQTYQRQTVTEHTLSEIITKYQNTTIRTQPSEHNHQNTTITGTVNPIGQEAGNLQPIGQEAGNLQPIGQEAGNLQPIGQEAGNLQPIGQEAGNLQPIGQEASNLQPIGRETNRKRRISIGFRR